MKTDLSAFFERYATLFREALKGDEPSEAIAAQYAAEFIAASPAGVMSGKNDDSLQQAMKQGYERYRAIGTKDMRIREVRVTPLDDNHAVAHVAWTATYQRKNKPDLPIEFDVHYLVQELDNGPKIFGWVSGDEQALLREHGIV
jgi:hypothetical protein